MNRRSFFSSLLALIPIPFLEWKRAWRFDPKKQVFKDAVGSIVEAQAVAMRDMTELNHFYHHGHDFYILTTGGNHALQG